MKKRKKQKRDSWIVLRSDGTNHRVELGGLITLAQGLGMKPPDDFIYEVAKLSRFLQSKGVVIQYSPVVDADAPDLEKEVEDYGLLGQTGS